MISDLIEKLWTGDVIPEACEGIMALKAAQADALVGTLMAKLIHGVYYQQAMAVEGNDLEGTFAWLSDSRFQAETEGLVFAVQDSVIMMNRYKHTVLKTSATSTCRVCREGDETIGHILSSCMPHAWSLYKERHDRVVYQLMIALAKKLDVRVPDSMKWGVDGWHGVADLNGRKAKIAVDLTVPTDRQLSDRRPDILLYLKESQEIMILEVAVTWELLLADRERQKSDKYQELAADLATQHHRWRVTVVPSVVGCLGTLNSLRANLKGLDVFT